MSHRLEVVPVHGLPEIATGDRLGELIAEGLADAGVEPVAGDVVAVAQKAVSKAEGRVRELDDVAPGPEARRLAERLGKDPRLVELILSESRAVVRAERDLLIVETRSGWICANAGIDASNVPGTDRVTLLPEDADASARRIRAQLGAAAGVRPGGGDQRQLRAAVAPRPGRRRDRMRGDGAARRLARPDGPRGSRAGRHRGRGRRRGGGGSGPGARQGHGRPRLPGARAGALRQRGGRARRAARSSDQKPRTCSASQLASIGSGWPSSVNSGAS